MRVESQVRAPVEQAQLINAGSFRFDTSQAEGFGQIGKIVGELTKRKQGMQDRIAVSNTNAAMKKAQLDYQSEIIGKPLDQHAAILQKHVNMAKTQSLSQKMSKDARATADNSLATWGQTFTDTGELATITSLHKEDRIRVTADLEEALVEGDGVQIEAAQEAFDEHFSTDPEAGRKIEDGVETRAIRLMENNAVNAVHEAIEQASQPGGTGNFEIAKELAKSPSIDGQTSTALNSAIKTAEKALETRQTNAVKAQTKQVTSQTVTDFWTLDERGNSTMTVPELMKRRATGFLEDAEFKSMMTSLTETVPDDSDGFAMGRIRRGIADFETGNISRTELDKLVLEDYSKLDGTDRSNIPSEVESVSSKILGTAKSNAYSEGSSLRSVQFVGIETESEFIKAFAGSGLTETEKININKRRVLEINNQDLYERAVNDRLNEMRKNGIEDVGQYRSESLKILLQYQYRASLKFKDFERKVRADKLKALGRGAKAPEPKETQLKKVSEMTREEKLAELRKLSQ